MTKTGSQIPCPGCQQLITWNTDNPSRPFCSERCKTEDFIAWADETHATTGNGHPENSLRH